MQQAETKKTQKQVTKHNHHEFGNNLRIDPALGLIVLGRDGKELGMLEVYTQLAAPFADDVVEKTDKSVTKKGYDTTGVKYQAVVDRFNDVVTPWGWGYRIVKEDVFVTYKSAGGRDMFEADFDVEITVLSKTFTHTGNHTASSKGDARKGAVTNALKKCAAMFGNGRQVYLGILDDDNLPIDEKSAKVAPQKPAKEETKKTEAKVDPAAFKEEDILGKCTIGKTVKNMDWLKVPVQTLEMISVTKQYPKEAAIAKELLRRHASHERWLDITRRFADNMKVVDAARLKIKSKLEVETINFALMPAKDTEEYLTALEQELNLLDEFAKKTTQG